MNFKPVEGPRITPIVEDEASETTRTKVPRLIEDRGYYNRLYFGDTINFS